MGTEAGHRLTELLKRVLATGDPTSLSLWGKGGLMAQEEQKETILKLLAGRCVAGFFGSSGLRPTEATEICRCGNSLGHLLWGWGLADAELGKSNELAVIRDI